MAAYWNPRGPTPFNAVIRHCARTFWAAALVASCPPALAYQGAPELRIDPEQHTAMINRMDLDREGRLLATASDDKTVRLWGLPEGDLQRVFRPYSELGSEGKLFAAALSPDGSLIAAGGWTKGRHRGFGNHQIYFFDARRGRLVTRIAGLDNTILHLDFSEQAGLKDGALSGYLACSLAENNGIRVWRLENQTEALRDMNYAGGSYWVEFSPDGESLVSTSYDGRIRLYKWDESHRSLLRHKAVQLDTTGRPLAARFSPDGGRIAVGYTDETRVAVLSATDLALEYWAEAPKGASGDLFATAWSQDGDVLFGGGGLRMNSRNAVARWTEGKEPSGWPVADNTLMQLDSLGGERLLYAASSPSWGVLNHQGEKILEVPRPTLRFNAIFPEGFRLSEDGKVVEFGYAAGEHEGVLRFSVEDGLLAPPAKEEPVSAADKTDSEEEGPPKTMAVREAQGILKELGYEPGKIDGVLGPETRGAIEGFQSDSGLAVTSELDADTVGALRAAMQGPSDPEPPAEAPIVPMPPVTVSEGLQLSPWRNSDEPRLNERKLQLTQNDTAISYAFTHGGQGLVLGTRFRLHLFDANGEERWAARTPGIAWAVNVAANDKVLAAAFGDGTLRWYGMRNGEELFALYPHADGRRWVAWTPHGDYAASVGGDGLAGWALNNQALEAADFIPLANLRRKAYRPEGFAAILSGLDQAEEPSAPDLAGGGEGAASSGPQETGRKPAQAVAFPPRVLVERPLDGAGFSTPQATLEYRIRPHGGEAPERLRLLLDGRPWQELEFAAREEDAAGIVELELPPRDLTLSLIAESPEGLSPVESVRLRWEGESAPRGESTLFLLSVGVDDYASEEFEDLTHCTQGAQLLAERLPGRAAFDNVETKLLTDPAGAEVSEGLDWLRQASPGDLAVVYLCGHSARKQGPAIDTYLFLPKDGTAQGKGLAASALARALGELRGNVLLIADTAYFPRVSDGGRVLRSSDVAGLANQLSSPWNGVMALSATAGAQSSEVSADGEGSVFLEALIEALEGQAKPGRSDPLTAVGLSVFLVRRVAELTEGRQTPRFAIPQTVSDFPLLLLRSEPSPGRGDPPGAPAQRASEGGLDEGPTAPASPESDPDRGDKSL